MRLFALVLALFASACLTTQARDVQTSGFLSDYSILKKGDSEHALLMYQKPGLTLKGYDKAILDPVRAWRAKDSQLKDVSREDLQKLVNLLHADLTEVLNEQFTLVKEPGPNTLRFRVALTEAGQSTVPLDLISTLVPMGLIASGAKSLATGTHSFVGSASLEAEITDASSGELLAAAVDRRAGGKSLEGVTNSWADVEEAFDFWADRLRTRLKEFKGA